MKAGHAKHALTDIHLKYPIGALLAHEQWFCRISCCRSEAGFVSDVGVRPPPADESHSAGLIKYESGTKSVLNVSM